MTKEEKRSLVAIPIVLLLAWGLAVAGSQGGIRAMGLHAFAAAVTVVFAIQWIVFVPSFIAKTEHFFDLTGSLTYIIVTCGLLTLAASNPRAWLLAALVLVWAIRLGAFLFMRVRRTGADDRFDEIKPSFVRFLGVWTIQGLWVSFTASAAWIAMTSPVKPMGWLAVVGVVVWVFGFAVETIADAQKTRFKADPANEGKFISTGLWARSRHPNYFGEIVLWIGVFLIAAPTFVGWQWVGVLSPALVALLLTRVSGIPLLEKKADQRWGGMDEYEGYKARTPVLMLKVI